MAALLCGGRCLRDRYKAKRSIKFTEQWSALLGGRFGRYENTFALDPGADDTVDYWSPTAPVEGVHSYLTYTNGMQDGGTAARGMANAFEPLGLQELE